MTGSANKDASISETLLAPLNELQALTHTLFLSLAPSQTKPPPPPPLSAFLECDRALAEAINLVHVHQIKQRKIDTLETEILQLESQWRDICSQLAKGKAELEETIEEGDERITAIEEARRGALPLEFLGSVFIHTSSVDSIPRTSHLCAESQRLYLSATQYA